MAQRQTAHAKSPILPIDSRHIAMHAAKRQAVGGLSVTEI